MNVKVLMDLHCYIKEVAYSRSCHSSYAGRLLVRRMSLHFPDVTLFYVTTSKRHHQVCEPSVLALQVAVKIAYIALRYLIMSRRVTTSTVFCNRISTQLDTSYCPTHSAFCTSFCPIFRRLDLPLPSTPIFSGFLDDFLKLSRRAAELAKDEMTHQSPVFPRDYRGRCLSNG